MFTKLLPKDVNDNYGVGKVKENFQVKIVDENETSLGVGEFGEIRAKGMFPACVITIVKQNRNNYFIFIPNFLDLLQ